MPNLSFPLSLKTPPFFSCDFLEGSIRCVPNCRNTTSVRLHRVVIEDFYGNLPNVPSGVGVLGGHVSDVGARDGGELGYQLM